MFSISPARTADALDALRSCDALAMPLLTEEARQVLLAAAEALPFRQARPYLGAPGKEVRQDFEICMTFETGDIFHRLAEALGALFRDAAQARPDSPLTEPPVFNDLAVQRYLPGSAGIGPHRDFLQFRQVVVLVLLAGRGRFFVCDNREGRDATEVPLRPGEALLMRAPGFAGGNRRPFHFLREITERRVIVGLRYDSKLNSTPG